MAQRTITLSGGTPYKVTAAREEDALPPAFANYPFLFVHYPIGWEYHDTAGFLPSLSAIVARPGVNGVGKDGNLSRAIGGSIQKGGIVVQTDDPRLGDWLDYVTTYPTRGGGRHYCFKGVGYVILPGGRVSTVDDPAADVAFRSHLRDAGMVHPLSHAVYQMILEIEQVGLARLEKRVNANPHLAEKLAAKRTRITAIHAAWAQIENAVVPEPAPASPAAIPTKPRVLRPESATKTIKAATRTVEAPGA